MNLATVLFTVLAVASSAVSYRRAGVSGALFCAASFGGGASVAVGFAGLASGIGAGACAGFVAAGLGAIVITARELLAQERVRGGRLGSPPDKIGSSEPTGAPNSTK